MTQPCQSSSPYLKKYIFGLNFLVTRIRGAEDRGLQRQAVSELNNFDITLVFIEMSYLLISHSTLKNGRINANIFDQFMQQKFVGHHCSN